MKIPDRLLQAAAIGSSGTPLVVQTEAAECGLACLAMIAGRYGYRVDLPALRQRYDVSLRGTTLHDMVRVAANLGLATRALRAEPHHLRQLRLPCILHWDHDHFVVLTRVSGRHMVVHDPAVGRRHVLPEEVNKRFTGVLLEAWPTQRFEQKTERARIPIWDLLRSADDFAAVATQVLLLSLVLEAAVIAIPIGFQLVLDDVVVAEDRDLLTLIAVALGLLLAFRTLADFARSWAIMGAGSRLTLVWKTSLFRHLLRLPLSFFERRHAGDVASRFTSLDRIQQTLSTASVSGVVDGVMALALVAHDVALRCVACFVGRRDDRDIRAGAQPRLPALSPRQ
jgi:ATP-binding cassette, subfamily B, bacterial CvaB/MchF/RaxB